MFKALRTVWLTVRLVKRADAAFAMASRGEDEAALRYLNDTTKALGPLTKYRFGIEPTLLEIYLRACLTGIKAEDYDWTALQASILTASEYNAAEKLHLIVYLEELATTAGVSLPVSDLVNGPTPKERVRRQLLRRFPMLSNA